MEEKGNRRKIGMKGMTVTNDLIIDSWGFWPSIREEINGKVEEERGVLLVLLRIDLPL